MRRTLIAALLAWLIGPGWAQAFNWDLRQFDGRDYVQLDQVAQFYGLTEQPRTIEKTRVFSRARSSLSLTQDSREVDINGARYTLCFPIIEQDGSYWVSRMDLGESMEPALRPEAVPAIKPFNTVVIDPGHGAQDLGAISRYQSEKNFALDVGRRLRDELQKAGLNVVMTRNSDTFVELHDRAAIANALPSCIFVSLHFNSSPSPAASGLEIFCMTPRGAPSTEYDELVLRDLIEENGNENNMQSFSLASAITNCLQGSSLTIPDRGLKRARFAVLRLTKVPAVLVEGGFLSNPKDAALVANTDWRNHYAHAIATGILEYKRLADFKQPPRQVADYRNGIPPRTATAKPTPVPIMPTGITLRDLPDEKTN